MHRLPALPATCTGRELTYTLILPQAPRATPNCSHNLHTNHATCLNLTSRYRRACENAYSPHCQNAANY